MADSETPTSARVKVSLEVPADLAAEIMELKRPLGLAMTRAINHLLIVGLDTVAKDHGGSLAMAIQHAAERRQA